MGDELQHRRHAAKAEKRQRGLHLARSSGCCSPDTLLGRPVQYLETMPDAAAGEAFLAVGDFKRGYFIVDHTTGVRTRPDNITEPGFYKVHTDKYLGGGVVDSNAIKVLELSGSGS
jgi:HK97 family phage major capsid protein